MEVNNDTRRQPPDGQPLNHRFSPQTIQSYISTIQLPPSLEFVGSVFNFTRSIFRWAYCAVAGPATGPRLFADTIYDNVQQVVNIKGQPYLLREGVLEQQHADLKLPRLPNVQQVHVTKDRLFCLGEDQYWYVVRPDSASIRTMRVDSAISACVNYDKNTFYLLSNDKKITKIDESGRVDYQLDELPLSLNVAHDKLFVTYRGQKVEVFGNSSELPEGQYFFPQPNARPKEVIFSSLNVLFKLDEKLYYTSIVHSGFLPEILNVFYYGESNRLLGGRNGTLYLHNFYGQDLAVETKKKLAIEQVARNEKYVVAGLSDGSLEVWPIFRNKLGVSSIFVNRAEGSKIKQLQFFGDAIYASYENGKVVKVGIAPAE